MFSFSNSFTFLFVERWTMQTNPKPKRALTHHQIERIVMHSHSLLSIHSSLQQMIYKILQCLVPFIALLSSALHFDNFLSDCKTRWVCTPHTHTHGKKRVCLGNTTKKCSPFFSLSPKSDQSNNKNELLHSNLNWTINTRKQWIDFHHSLVAGFRCSVVGPIFATHDNYHLNVKLNRFQIEKCTLMYDTSPAIFGNSDINLWIVWLSIRRVEWIKKKLAQQLKL